MPEENSEWEYIAELERKDTQSKTEDSKPNYTFYDNEENIKELINLAGFLG